MPAARASRGADTDVKRVELMVEAFSRSATDFEIWNPLQKLPSNRLDFDYLEAELGGAFLEQFDLLAAVPVLVILHSFIYVLLTVFQHPVH